MSKLRLDVEVKDGWLKKQPADQYMNYVYSAFEKKYEDENLEQVTLHKIHQMKVEDKPQKQLYLLEGDIIDGENRFYLLKKGRKMGNIMKREAALKNNSLFQYSKCLLKYIIVIYKQSRNELLNAFIQYYIESNKEKDLGKIERFTIIENPFKNEHLNKYVLKVETFKDEKRRILHLLFNDQNVMNSVVNNRKLMRNNKADFDILKTKIPKLFKGIAAQKFWHLFKKEVKSIKDAQQKGQLEEQQQKEYQKAMLNRVFKNFDQKHMVDMINKWKAEAINARENEENLTQKLLNQQKQQEKQRQQDLLKRSPTLKNLDRSVVYLALKNGIEKAKEKQQEEEEQHDKKKRAQAQPKQVIIEEEVQQQPIVQQVSKPVMKQNTQSNEKRLHLQFKQICLSASIQFIRPIIDIYYIPNNNVMHYTSFIKAAPGSKQDYIKTEQSPRYNQDTYTRVFNKKKWTLSEHNEAIFQMIFSGRMLARYSDNSYIWDLEQNKDMHQQFNTQM